MFGRITNSLLYRVAGRQLVDLNRFEVVPKVVSSQRNPISKLTKTAPAVFDGEHSRQWWTKRDRLTSSAEAYWSGRNHALRRTLGETLASLDGNSLLEIGCHAGMNLWSAAQFKRWRTLAGTELSDVVLKFARSKLPVEIGRDVDLHQAAADELPFPDASFDIVLTAGTLVCIGPESIERSLGEICRVARRWIVLVEPLEIDPRYATPDGREDVYPNTTYWIRDYAGLLGNRAALKELRPLRAEMQMGHLNSIAIFEVAGSTEAQRRTAENRMHDGQRASVDSARAGAAP